MLRHSCLSTSAILEIYQTGIMLVVMQYDRSCLICLLGNPPNECKLDNGKDALDQGGHSPRPVVGDIRGAEREPTTNESSKIPQAVVYSSDLATMLRVGNLGQQQRTRELGQRVAESHEETSSLILWTSLRRSLLKGNMSANAVSLRMTTIYRLELTWTAAAMVMIIHPVMIGILRPKRSHKNGMIGSEAMEPMEYIEVSNPKADVVGLPITSTQSGRSWDVFIKDLTVVS